MYAPDAYAAALWKEPNHETEKDSDHNYEVTKYWNTVQNKDDLKEFSELKLVDESKCALTKGSGVNLKKFTFSDLPKENIFGFDCRLTKEKGIQDM